MEVEAAGLFRVQKFGGTSVATAERIWNAARLAVADAEAHPGARVAVVTSALGGVTDRLVDAIEAARSRSDGHRAVLDEVRERHLEAAEAIVPPEELGERRAAMDTIFAELEELLQGIYLLRECTPRLSDAILCAGERLAAPLVAAALRAQGSEAVAIDARDLIRTDDAFGEAAVDFAASRDLIVEAVRTLPAPIIPVITGFVGATDDGVTTTLGRSGSDYTATLLAAALDAEQVIIWTDVDGVLSADPRLVPDAFTLPDLTYREAAELAHFGAKVLHPRTMRPIERAGIPLRIKNTMRPEAKGTLISANEREEGPPIKAVTAVRRTALITLDGAGLIGVPVLTARAFGALAEREVPVLLIAQASSEGSLCFVVRESDCEESLAVLRRAFVNECERGDLLGIYAEEGMAVIAAIGEGLRRAPGLAGKMFVTLARAHVNVRAIAEGASDHNLSCVVADDDAARAVDALHEAFALRRLRAHIVVIGAGAIGGGLLELLANRVGPLMEYQRLNLRLVALADSRRLVWADGGLRIDESIAALRSAAPLEADVGGAITARLAEARLERLIVVDATASEGVARRYPEWLCAGAAVVTPNQLALTQELGLLKGTAAAAAASEVPFLYETTVGAGLSVLSTLRDLVRTGDQVQRIQGAFSGTLAFVFSALRAGRSFSSAVREAADQGFTEPDPRADLAGEDVARKLVILAREMGLEAARQDVQVQSLVPEPLITVSLDEFWKRLPEFDDFWSRTRDQFRTRGQCLQYVALLDRDQLRAGVQALPVQAPLAKLEGASVLFAFHTDRYGSSPLVVQGPGANRAVTAAVLLADVVRAAEAMR